MRFVAPDRRELLSDVFARPPLADWSEYAHWLQSAHFPLVDELNQAWGDPRRFVLQTPQMLSDGLHYEARIHARGEIATRADNWHDLFNALVWRRYAPIKAALNARQVAEIDVVGDKQRSRAQCALTHMDEGGVIVVVRDPVLFGLWDQHDWLGFFWDHRQAWHDGRISAQVFGHALLEMALEPRKLITGKALAVLLSIDDRLTDPVSCIAQAIMSGQVLNDPQELRPLPISGIPGWHTDNHSAKFYTGSACFQPVRAGRIYPPPLRPLPGGS